MQTRFARPLSTVLALILLLPALARAGEGDGESLLGTATTTAPPAGAKVEDRAWLYNDPTRLPAAGHTVAFGRFTYSGGNSLTRPFAANIAERGALFEAGAEVGLGHGLALTALGAQSQATTSRTGAMVGLRWSLLPDSIENTQIVVSGGALRELGGSAGAWGRVAIGQDMGPARLAASVHAEHVFDPLRDPLDLMFTVGASLPVVDGLRAGVEYVGQDLEETFADSAEGGARHLAGPVVSAVLLGDRMSLTGGPALAFGNTTTRLVGRVGMSLQF